MSTTTNSILRDAMLALHEELGAVEVDIGSAPTASLAKLWQGKHDTLARFYDADVYHDRKVVSDYVTFLDAFPTTWAHTGGGCMAWQIDLPDGTHLLLTDDGGGEPPAAADDEVTVGWYDAEGQPMTGDCDVATWAEAADIVRKRMGGVTC